MLLAIRLGVAEGAESGVEGHRTPGARRPQSTAATLRATPRNRHDGCQSPSPSGRQARHAPGRLEHLLTGGHTEMPRRGAVSRYTPRRPLRRDTTPELLSGGAGARRPGPDDAARAQVVDGVGERLARVARLQPSSAFAFVASTYQKCCAISALIRSSGSVEREVLRGALQQLGAGARERDAAREP